VTSPDDLLNKGFIVVRESGEQGRAFIVSGLQRSGTSLIASFLQQAGIFIGSEINDAVYEDEAISDVLAARDLQKLRRIIDAGNAMRALRSSIADQSALMEFIGQLSCPNLLLSYEKTLNFSEDFIDLILRFCDILPSAALGTRMLAIIEPNRPRYLATARRPFDGLIEGVRDGQLYGRC
jgi:hypothetical protein